VLIAAFCAVALAAQRARHIQKMMDLTGLKQIALSKKIGISQGTLNRWLNRVNVPNKTQWDRVMTVWREIQGIKLTIDQKIAPYDVDTQLTIHKMLDNYLRLLPPPRPQRTKDSNAN
jgi:phage-related minor tail protein